MARCVTTYLLDFERALDQSYQHYAAYALSEPTSCKIVTIAEPRQKTRELFARAHNIDNALVFSDWQDLLKASAETIEALGRRLADGVVVAVQDHMHRDVVLAFAAQGYHILCEKPMATSLRDCFEIENAVKKAGIIFGMGHGWSPSLTHFAHHC